MEKTTPVRPDRPRRGRRPAGSDTRAAIERAAREQFGELGYRRTTVRGVARAAGVDPRLVRHYHGSKRDLFVSTMRLPIEPEAMLDHVFADGPGSAGERLARVLIGVLGDADSEQIMTGLIRAAASEPEAAEAVRQLLAVKVLTPLARRVGGPAPELRASLMASQIVGLGMARNVVGLPALLGAPREQLISAVAPVLDHYLSGTWLEAASD